MVLALNTSILTDNRTDYADYSSGHALMNMANKINVLLEFYMVVIAALNAVTILHCLRRIGFAPVPLSDRFTGSRRQLVVLIMTDGP